MIARVYFDVETALTTPDDPWKPIIALGWYAPGIGAGILDRAEALPFLANVEREGATLVAHNASYDMGTIARTWPALLPWVWHMYERGRVLCTAEGTRLRDIRETGILRKGKGQYTLDAALARYAGGTLDKSDPWRLRWQELEGLPSSAFPADAKAYLAHDVAALATLGAQVCEETDLPAQSANDWWLERVAKFGFRTDRARVQAKARELEARLAPLRARCGGLYHPDGARNMLAIRAFAEAAGIRTRTAPTKTFPRGQVQVNEDTIGEATSDPDGILSAYAETLGIEAQLSRLVPMLDTDRVRCYYHMLASGRRGAEKPNVQNFPRKGGWRECTMPDPGCVYGICDFTGLELATVAEVLSLVVSPDNALARALRAGKDAHVLMAASMVQASDEWAEHAYAGALGPEAKKYVKENRQTAKVPNFGYPGGLGPGGFVKFAWTGYQYRCTFERAKELKAIWLNRWPEFTAYFRDRAALERAGADVLVPYSGFRRGGCSFTEACNTPFQGLGALVATLAGFRIQRECEIGSMQGSAIAIFAHDEFVTNMPEGLAQEHVQTQARIMRETGREVLQYVPLDTAPILAERWSKEAESTGAPGALTIWKEGTK